MQALVLAGGEGTRLRPLTLTVPKPVVPLAGRPFLSFMLDWLSRHGIDDVLIACGYRAEMVERVLGERHRAMRLRYLVEDSPLGTAGPLRLAADSGMLEERVTVLNGDCLADFDLTAQRDAHERSGAAVTLALHAVADTASYGVVPTGPGGEVEAFLEKSDGPAPTNRINAGAYVLERSVVERIPAGRPVSFEREVFPGLVGHGLHGFDAEGYWIDIGTPERYLEATRDLLAGEVASDLPARDQRSSLVYPGGDLADAEVGPLTVVGHDCAIGAGTRIERSVLFDGVSVGSGCRVSGAIVADGVRLEDGCRVEPGSIVGSGATVGRNAVVGGEARVEPGGHVA
ncbi:MAG: NDP-sugar synthase [Thermoleophilaceae bacterium]